MKTFYNLHNVVGIEIDTQNAAIIKEYEYCLRHFRVDALGKPADILVLDLGVFVLPQDAFNVHDSLFGFSSGVYDKEKKYAVVFDGPQMKLYIKESNICLPTLIEYFLLPQSMTFVHGAAVSYKNKGIIFPAPPNVGKTLLVSRLRNKEHIKFFGDDYVVVGADASLRAFPADFSIYHYHFNFFPELKKKSSAIKIKRAWYERAVVNLIKHSPIKYTAKRVARAIGYDFLQGGEFLKVPASTLIQKEKFGSVAPLEYAVFLNKYDGKEFKFEAIDATTGPAEIMGILQSEWVQTMPVYHLLSAFGIVDFAKHIETIHNVLASALKDLKIYRVLIPAHMDVKEHIEKLEAFLQQEIFSKIDAHG